MPLSSEYVRLVLNENFEDAKTLFLRPLFAIHEAHLVMLAETGIVPLVHARAIRAALDAVDRDAISRAAFDGTCEDLFFYVDRLLNAIAGPEAAGRLHTARSRNDVDMTMYRMRLREWLLGIAGVVADLRRTLVALAAAHRETVFPAHTHGQPAQPTTLAHYLLAVIEMLERDAARLAAAYRSTNLNPLGACAITGTGFPIDRARTAALLGFRAPTGNTYGSIAAVDYLLEAAAAAATLVVGVGRVVQDLLLWSTREVGYLRLADDLVQISSIMPQKRNPVALEHARALASRAHAELGAIAGAVHNTPFGDIVDTEDDLQPLVARAFADATRAVALTRVAVDGATFDRVAMQASAERYEVSVTELADALAREEGLPFSAAHAIATGFIRIGGSTGATPAARLAAAARALGLRVDADDARVLRWLSPAHFVEIRRTPGGPAPELTDAALDEARAALARDEAFCAGARQALAAADAARRAALDAL
jgi:argininosuccinate lyase